MPNWTTISESYIDRHLEESARTVLTDTRIVAIVGPRQSGKTTLARRIADSDGREFVSLDDQQVRHFAQDDPVGFVRRLQFAAIDEIQRAPSLFLALKKTVDENPKPGRYLITGSVDLFRSEISPDSLAGRVETIELLPLSQAEMTGQTKPRFLERAFRNDFPPFQQTGPTPDLVERVLAGGYPAALARSSSDRRRNWLESYAQTLAEREVSDLARVGKRNEMTRLIEHAANLSGHLLNLAGLGTRIEVDGKTVDRWITLLEHMFVMRRVHAWHSNQLKRLVKAPKLHFLDSGLLAALQQTDATDISRTRQKLGPLLESFVFGEIAKATAHFDAKIRINHYRDKDGIEVDFVIEGRSGLVVGIKIKAGATAHPQDFKGLNRLKETLAHRFACGILLHDGERIQQVASKLYAMPFRMLWEA